MPTAVQLLREGRYEDLWQMCCGFLRLSRAQFMEIQERLLLEQISLLRGCELGRRIMRGASPRTVDEFRRQVPLTSYADYCPDLLEKREDILPVKPEMWVHTSGKSGEYSCKWVPITPAFADNLSVIMYGVGMLSACRGWGDSAYTTGNPRIVYAVAPRPYMSGAMTSMMSRQTPMRLMPPLEEAEKLSFEDRIKVGLEQALSEGFDYFHGLSLVLVAVGSMFSQSSTKTSIRPLLSRPGALFRLTRGLLKSKLAGRRLLPRDIWSIKGIMSGGLDSFVYREKIKELWGRYPLDVYAGTEGGLIATQTWDYGSMTFIPGLNFLEFIPQEEYFKWQLDSSYQPGTVLLDEVEAGETYEIVITNFHGGAMVRYRPGDMVRITALRNEKLGIDIPQMVFERRADDLIDFVVIRLTEKLVWQAVENTGMDYEDWTACKEPGEPVLRLYIELKDGCRASEAEIGAAVQKNIMESDGDAYARSHAREDLADMIDFRVEATLLPGGSFRNFTERRQQEGADLAHLKPPHLNPPEKVLSMLLATSAPGHAETPQEAGVA